MTIISAAIDPLVLTLSEPILRKQPALPEHRPMLSTPWLAPRVRREAH